MAPYTLDSTPELPATPRPIVIIGAGGIVKDAHLPAYRQAGFPVAGIYDLDQHRARALASQFDIPIVYADMDEAVDTAPADAVFDVAVPAGAQRAVLPHLPRGRGLLLQKPLGEKLDDARALRALCRDKALVAGVNFQLRYAPFVLAARSLIQQGAIGKLIHMAVNVSVYTPWHLWTYLEKVPCMEVKYHSVHYLDLMRSFLGDPHGIYAKVTNHPAAPKMDGTGSDMILDYGPDLRATIATNHFHRFGLAQQQSSITWEGTGGAIKATMGLLMNYPDGVPDQFVYYADSGAEAGKWQQADFAGSWFPDAFIGTMASVMAAVDGSAPGIPTSVEDAFRTMALVDGACRASRAGGTPIDYQG